MANLLAAASTWFTGLINAAKMQANLIDPINAFAAQFGSDSDWQPLTIAAGFQAGGLDATAPQYRVFNGLVFFKGHIQPSPAGNFAASQTITICPAGAIPAGARPQNVAVDQGAGSAVNLPVRIFAQSDGSIGIFTSTTPPAYVSLTSLIPYIGEI